MFKGLWVIQRSFVVCLKGKVIPPYHSSGIIVLNSQITGLIRFSTGITLILILLFTVHTVFYLGTKVRAYIKYRCCQYQTLFWYLFVEVTTKTEQHILQRHKLCSKSCANGQWKYIVNYTSKQAGFNQSPQLKY